MHQADQHNFGHKVTSQGSAWFIKPRPTFLEHLLLDPRSELRRLFSTTQTFDFLPNLLISKEFDFFKDAQCQTARQTRTEELDAESWTLASEKSGRLLALCLWFGMSDLHHQNVVRYLKHDVQEIVPIDIELFLNKLVLPHRTNLIPSKRGKLETAGLGFLLQNPNLELPDLLLPLVFGYIKTIGWLESSNTDIAKILESYGQTQSIYCRVLLNKTSDYLAILNKQLPANLDLCPEEREQLARGEIPFFFREARSDSIYYFSESAAMKAVESEQVIERFTGRFIFLSDFASYCDSQVVSYLTAGVADIIQSVSSFVAHNHRPFQRSHNNLHINFDGKHFTVQYGKLHVTCCI